MKRNEFGEPIWLERFETALALLGLVLLPSGLLYAAWALL